MYRVGEEPENSTEVELNLGLYFFFFIRLLWTMVLVHVFSNNTRG